MPSALARGADPPGHEVVVLHNESHLVAGFEPQRPTDSLGNRHLSFQPDTSGEQRQAVEPLLGFHLCSSSPARVWSPASTLRRSRYSKPVFLNCRRRERSWSATSSGKVAGSLPCSMTSFIFCSPSLGSGSSPSTATWLRPSRRNRRTLASRSSVRSRLRALVKARRAA